MNHLLLAATAVILCGAIPVDVSAEATAADPAVVGIEEIVVTAQRRAEKIQDVPLAITAISAKQLEENRIVDNYGLQALTPGLVVTESSGYAVTFLRGVGTPSIIAGDEPSVATYIDGFYQGPSVISVLPYNNVDHVEVLKGPQGTLYGRNATGGLINIVTPTPSDEFILKGSVGYGNYDTVETDDYVTGRLSDGVKADLSVHYRNQGEGVARNLTTGNRIGKDEGLSLRSKVAFDISQNTILTIGAEYTHHNASIGNTLYTMPGTTPLGALLGGKFTTTPFVNYNNVDPLVNVNVYGFNAKLQSDLGPVRFVSMSQYRHATETQVVDVDGTSADNIPFVLQPGVGKFPLPTITYSLTHIIPYFVTQEFQLLSRAERPISWIVGAFGMDSRDGDDPFDVILNSATFVPIGVVTAYNTTRAYAGYAQSTYAFDSGLSLTAGVRYSDEHKHTVGSQSGGRVLLTDDKEKTWNSVTYRFAADYRFNEKVLAYGSASKGFKSGAFNVTSIDPIPAVNPETLYDYEVGVKSDPFSWLRINGSAYYYDYKNIQFYGYPKAAGLPVLENAAAATLYGTELDVEVRPLRELTLTGNIAWEHSRYDSFNSAQVYIPAPVAGEVQISANATGQPLIRTPRLSGNLGASYDFHLPRNTGQLTLAGNVYHNSGYSFDPLGVINQSSYSVVDGSLTWTLPGGKWSAAAWAKNLADERYYTQVVSGGRGSRVGYDPRTYGLNVRYQVE